MRLLNTATLKLESFLAREKPKYAILSHTWGQNEVVFEDLRDGKSAKDGCDGKETSLSKVLKSAEQATKDGLRYIWIDTCCIDKSSSADLSEAINSMFAWYQNSEICYAFLEDYVPGKTQLQHSRWFTRGWTLQELIAPRTLHYFDADWIEFGDRVELCTEVAEITGIDARVLHRHYTKACAMREPPGTPATSPGGSSATGGAELLVVTAVQTPGTASRLGNCRCPASIGIILEQYSIAEKMTWAESRKTCRPEDVAYSLMGLFSVTMPLLYGEGKQRSFTRLQEEIARHANDQTLLLWWEGYDTVANQDSPVSEKASTEEFSLDEEEEEREDIPIWGYQHHQLFAKDPLWFQMGRYFRPPPATRDSSTSKEFDLAYSNAGIHLKVHLAPCPDRDSESTHIAVLNCADVRDEFVRAGLMLRKTGSSHNSFCLSGRPPVRIVHGSNVVRGSPRSWHKLPRPRAAEHWSDLLFDPAELKRTYIVLEDNREVSMPGVEIPTVEYRFPSGKGDYSIVAIAPDPVNRKRIYRSPATLPVQARLMNNITFIYGALAMEHLKDSFFILWGRRVDNMHHPDELDATWQLPPISKYPPRGQPDVYIFHKPAQDAASDADPDDSHVYAVNHLDVEDVQGESGRRAWIRSLVETAEGLCGGDGDEADDLRTPGMAVARWETKQKKNRVTVKAWMESVEFLGREKTYVNVEIASRDGWEAGKLERARTLQRAASRGL